ncbi:MAG: hypothetical protein R2856_21585 [Caldilineaceae bacterium]
MRIDPTSPQLLALTSPETGTPQDALTPEPSATPEETSEETAEATLEATLEATPVPSNSPSAYRLISVSHGNECPGGYLIGRIVNNQGGPVAGVRVRMIDGWGNYYESMSKSGAADFGRFDFPLYSDSPQDLRVTVLDDGGMPISPTVTVPHRQSAESDFPCHFVVMQRN